MYWARALAQLSAQATSGKETVTFSDILVEFVNANKVAVLSSTKVAWEYDRHLWTDLADRLRRREHDVNVQSTFRKLEPSDVTTAAQTVAARSQASKMVSPTPTQPPKPNQKTAVGGKGGKYGGGKLQSGKWSPATGSDQSWGSSSFWGSGGGPSGKGKGGNKSWTKESGQYNGGKSGGKDIGKFKANSKRTVKEEK